jgi:NADPH:quinone reductase-like Zn-dependent oxidoreductase
MIPMKAVRIHQYGDAGVLVYEDAPVLNLGLGRFCSESWRPE